MDCNTPGFPVHHQLPELVQTHGHRVSDTIQPSHPLSSPLLLPSIFPCIKGFSNESVLHIRWPKYWTFSFSNSPSNEYSGLISYGLSSLISLQSKELSRVFSNTTVQKHQFFGSQNSFMVQLSHPYITIGKIICLTVGTFVSHVISNILSRLLIVFLLRSKCLLI